MALLLEACKAYGTEEVKKKPIDFGIHLSVDLNTTILDRKVSRQCSKWYLDFWNMNVVLLLFLVWWSFCCKYFIGEVFTVFENLRCSRGSKTYDRAVRLGRGFCDLCFSFVWRMCTVCRYFENILTVCF